MTRARALRAIRIVLIFAVPFLVLLTVRAHVAAEHELERARIALSTDHTREAIALFRNAARWDAPLNSAASEAFKQLGRIAQDAELAGDRDNALRAWRAIRAASLSSQGVVEPRRALRRLADDHIAALTASARTLAREVGQSTQARQAARTDELERAAHKARGFADLACIAFVVFALCLFQVISRGFDEETRFLPQHARIWLAGAATSGLLCLLSLALA